MLCYQHHHIVFYHQRFLTYAGICAYSWVNTCAPSVTLHLISWLYFGSAVMHSIIYLFINWHFKNSALNSFVKILWFLDICYCVLVFLLDICKLSLRKLDISSNRIEKIPTVFRKLETLEEIILEHNPLSSPPAHVGFGVNSHEHFLASSSVLMIMMIK